jgi:predicted transcriptional regulator
MPLKLIKSYNFTDKDPIVDKMRGPIRRSRMTEKEIATDTGLHIQTVRNIFGGKTKHPRYSTVIKIMRCCGHMESFTDFTQTESPKHEAPNATAVH